MKTYTEIKAVKEGKLQITEKYSNRLPITNKSGAKIKTFIDVDGETLQIAGKSNIVREKASYGQLSINCNKAHRTINIANQLERIEAEMLSIAGGGRYSQSNQSQYARRK